jgi:hypothetical protein
MWSKESFPHGREAQSMTCFTVIEAVHLGTQAPAVQVGPREGSGSLHVVLPPRLAADVSTKGWGRPHMWAGTRLSPGFMLVHGPRDDDELATVRGIVAASHAYAAGTPS